MSILLVVLGLQRNFLFCSKLEFMKEVKELFVLERLPYSLNLILGNGWSLLSLDLTGPFSEKEFRYLFVIVDY